MKTFLHEAFKENYTGLIIVFSLINAADSVILTGILGVFQPVLVIIPYMIQNHLRGCFLRFMIGLYLFLFGTLTLLMIFSLGDIDGFIKEWLVNNPDTLLTQTTYVISIFLNIVTVILGIQFFEYSNEEIVQSRQIPLYNNSNQQPVYYRQ